MDGVGTKVHSRLP